MFITRPLTWLFVIATIVVDLVLMVAWSAIEEHEEVLLGYVLGQVAAVAIWAVRGSIHRLLRASCLVLATGLLARGTTPEPGFLTFIFVYATAIFVFALLVEVVWTLQDDSANEIEQRKRWQFPIIEFFGWTIVVAVVSLGTRQMEFKEVFSNNSEAWLQLLAILSVPILLVLFTRKDLCDLRSIKALIIVAAATAAGWYFSSHDASFLIPTQAAYLVAWMTVLTLDNISAEANRVQENRQEESPKIYDPHAKHDAD